MKVLAALVVFMFAALTTRLWFLQVLAAPQFSKLANDNQVRLVPIDPLRGEILDRNGNVLVENTSTTAIVVNRQALGDEKDAVLIRLSALLNVPLADIQKRVDSVRYLPYQPVPIAENISPQVIFFIREHQKQFPGVGYLQVPVREYPEGTLAAHILGYLGEINQKQLDSASYQGYQSNEVVGQAGVEASYEHDLHGTPGERAIQVDAQGRILNENFRTIQPEAGDNLVLSIDDNVQRLAEQSLAIGIRATR
jgi:penicillin-binding protein 2